MKIFEDDYASAFLNADRVMIAPVGRNLAQDQIINTHKIAQLLNDQNIEAQAFKQMGFKTVKIYEINKWIDECNPVVTKYSAGEHKDGTKTKFGNYYAEHCKK